MKEKGFTLIELLAVIVILAIIALIATPIVLNIIEDSKDSSKLNSANHYIDAVEFSIAQYMMEGNSIEDGEYSIIENGNICLGTLSESTCSDEMVVEVNGEVPTIGTIATTGGQIIDASLIYENKIVIMDETGNLIFTKVYNNGEVVYFNVTTGKKCTDYTETQSTIGVKEGCMKFYTFNDKEGSETVNLILDHNTTEKVAWTNSDTESNANGPIDLLTNLYTDTKDWKGTKIPEDYASGASYVIKYSETPSIQGAIEPYKARLITANEIIQITGIDGLEYYDLTLYGWLNPSSIGYWTSDSASWNYAWLIAGGRLNYSSVHFAHGYGVRPVIEVLKSKLS